MKKLAALATVLVLAYVFHSHYASDSVRAPTGEIPASDTGRPLSQGEVAGSGTVVRILPDDEDGDRHQRFILRLASGQTLLVAHNIDLAPRVSPLREGDTVEYKGEYAWNEKGGVVHWTHHDPAGHHAAGWLKHDGQTFQ